MSIDPQYRDCMDSTVELLKWDSMDKYAQRTWSTSVSVRARIVEKPQMVRDVQGREIMSRITVWLYGSPGVSPKDRLVLPDTVNARLGGASGDTYPILTVEAYPDEDGAHHEKVLVQ